MPELSPAWFIEHIDPIDQQGHGLCRVTHRTCVVFYSYKVKEVEYCPKCSTGMDNVEIFQQPQNFGKYNNIISSL